MHFIVTPSVMAAAVALIGAVIIAQPALGIPMIVNRPAALTQQQPGLRSPFDNFIDSNVLIEDVNDPGVKQALAYFNQRQPHHQAADLQQKPWTMDRWIIDVPCPPIARQS